MLVAALKTHRNNSLVVHYVAAALQNLFLKSMPNYDVISACDIAQRKITEFVVACVKELKCLLQLSNNINQIQKLLEASVMHCMDCSMLVCEFSSQIPSPVDCDLYANHMIEINRKRAAATECIGLFLGAIKQLIGANDSAIISVCKALQNLCDKGI